MGSNVTPNPMNILVIDGGHLEAEFRAKFGPAHEYTFISADYESTGDWPARQATINEAATVADVAFCFCEPAESRNSYPVIKATTLP